jgi:hypothetical protein
MEMGAKIHIVPIRCTSITDGREDIFFNHTVGFAYAGSSLLASNVLAIASSLCQMICADQNRSVPSLETIAKIFTHCGSHVIKNMNFLHPKGGPHRFGGLIFGFCPIEKKPLIYQIGTIISSADTALSGAPFYDADMKRLVDKKNTITCIGSGKEEFWRRHDAREAKGKASDPFGILREVIEDEAISDVGGSILQARADKNGCVIYTTLVDGYEGRDGVYTTLLGVDITFPIDGFTFGREAVFTDLDRVFIREWLERRGRNPNWRQASEKTRNLALIETQLVVCNGRRMPMSFDRFVMIEPASPQMGVSYLTSKCATCSRAAPLIAIPLTFDMNLVRGDGGVITKCFFCGGTVLSKLVSAEPYIWNIPTY